MLRFMTQIDPDLPHFTIEVEASTYEELQPTAIKRAVPLLGGTVELGAYGYRHTALRSKRLIARMIGTPIAEQRDEISQDDATVAVSGQYLRASFQVGFQA